MAALVVSDAAGWDRAATSPATAEAARAAKADLLLLQGRVRILRRSASSVRARVQGDRRPYECGWRASMGWWCSCPSRSAWCSHLLAVRRVSATPRPARDPLAFVTLTRLPSRAELHADPAAPEYPGRSDHDPRPVSPRPSLGPETIDLQPAAGGR